MPALRLSTAAAIAAGLIAAPAAMAQGPARTATTQAQAAQATGKPTSDAPAGTQVQGTAQAVRQGTAAGTATAPAAATVVSVNLAPSGDLITTLQANGHFKTFLKALDATNLTPVLKNNQNLTIFAPTDEAFAALAPGEVDRMFSNLPGLQKQMTHMIINAPMDSSKFKGARGPVKSVAGDDILLDGSENKLVADNADIVQADVKATNGIIHVVDKVMTPLPASAMATPPAATGAAAATSATAPAAPAAKPAGTKRRGKP